jgi:hypothetical protein
VPPAPNHARQAEAGNEVNSMQTYLDTLLGKAFERIPGALYNEYRYEVTERSARPYLFYEVSLMDEKPWEYLRDRVYPSWIRYLKAKFFDPMEGSGVVVAIFHRESCYLVRGEDFLATFREVEGIDRAALRARVEQWLST